MIIIEGPNGVGKSTLAKRLLEQLPELRYHKVALTMETVKHLDFKWYLKQTQLLRINYLVDRWHLGQIVYPQLYKDGRKPLAIEEQHLLERILMNLGVVLVYCDASTTFIKNVYQTRGEKWQTESEISPELELFRQAISTSILPVVHYSPEMSIKKQQQAINTIIYHYLKNNQASKRLSAYHGSGTCDGSIMLVGDRINLTEKLKLHAFSGATGSSLYLHKTLSLTTFKRNVYLTNAYKVKALRQNMT